MSEGSRNPISQHLHSESESSSDEDADEDGELQPERPTKVKVFDEGGPLHVSSIAVQCGLAPHRHPLNFATVDEFEIHYTKEHTNRCSSCGKNFATAHFLSLHIDEHHNPVREALQAKGEKTYSCFVEDCDKKCSNPQKRKLHLIDKHMFPKAYHFNVIRTGIDKTSTMLRENHRRRVSTSTNPGDISFRRQREMQNVGTDIAPRSNWKGSTISAAPHKRSLQTFKNEDAATASSRKADLKSRNNVDVVDLEQSMSALNFIPSSVSRKQELSHRATGKQNR